MIDSIQLGKTFKILVLMGLIILALLMGRTVLATSSDSLIPSPTVEARENSPDLIEEEKPQPKEPVFLQLNLPAARLDLFINGKFNKSYPVSIGMPKYPTPIRDFNISMIIWNPWWIPPDSDWAKDAKKTPPGPGNPLGVVKMMMEAGVRIHGTNKRSSIGRAQSHACVRMFNDDAREVAWTIQERYSEKSDPELQSKYKKNRRSSYYVKLFEEVPVEVIYRQVERKGDRILLHPNRYWRKGFQGELEDALTDYPEILVDKNLIKKLDKMRRGKTVEVPVKDLIRWGTPDTPSLSTGSPPPGLTLNSHSAQALSSD